jgi:hypothetical protein
MNETKYITQEYKGSEAYKCVMGATKEQLQHRKYYTQGAIDYHKLSGNTEQEKFFREEMALINKRLGIK